MMKFLIAGFGSIGRRHFRNLLALGQKDILFLRSQKGTLSSDEIAGFPVETEIRTALAHKPDAVIVSNPTSMHLDVAIPAAEMGAHLLLEKPISHSMARVDQLRAAVTRGGGQILVGFQFRFHPGLEKIALLLKEGDIGRPLSVRAHWGEYLPDWHPWENYRDGYSARADLGGGVVLTLSHPLDYLRWFLGDVESLWSFTSSQSNLDLQVEDTAEIGLRFSNGVIGSVHLNYTQRPPVHRLEIVGERGTIHWDNSDGAVYVYRVEKGLWEIISPPEGFSRNDLFLDEMRHFIALAQGNADSLCTLDDGVQALQLAEKILSPTQDS
ncbi:MAG: Gfo/Idh/MocA family oxidoreductase [Chloroflexota bacterium]